jgi:hypothetical protein
MKKVLTDRGIGKLVAPAGGRVEVLDAKMPGLALRVTRRPPAAGMNSKRKR